MVLLRGVAVIIITYDVIMNQLNLPFSVLKTRLNFSTSALLVDFSHGSRKLLKRRGLRQIEAQSK